MHFEVYKDKAGEYRSRLLDTNGETLAFTPWRDTKKEALAIIKRIQSEAPNAIVVDNS